MNQRTLAAFLGIHTQRIVEWTAKGQFPKGQRVGRQTLYTLGEVKNYVEHFALPVSPVGDW
jgi:hypothetical protein